MVTKIHVILGFCFTRTGRVVVSTLLRDSFFFFFIIRIVVVGKESVESCGKVVSGGSFVVGLL